MPIQIAEHYTSRALAKEEAELVFTATGSEDEDAIYAAAVAEAPPIFKGMALQDVRTRPLGGGVWECTGRYGTQQPKKLVGDSTFAFDTTGGTQKITRSARVFTSPSEQVDSPTC